VVLSNLRMQEDRQFQLIIAILAAKSARGAKETKLLFSDRTPLHESELTLRLRCVPLIRTARERLFFRCAVETSLVVSRFTSVRTTYWIPNLRWSVRAVWMIAGSDAVGWLPSEDISLAVGESPPFETDASDLELRLRGR